MKKAVSLLLALTLCFSLAPLTLVSAATSVYDLIGVYEGSYDPSQGTTGLTLTVYQEGDDVKAIFDFYNLPGRTNSEEGSYYMSVSYNAESGQFELRGTEWIESPGGYIFVNLYGTLNGDTFSGTKEYSFNVTRESTSAPAPSATPWSAASSWAAEELNKAYEAGLIPDSLLNTDLTQPITRAEFAGVAVKVYESLNGVEAIPAVVNPFKDTNDLDVLKAYNLNVVEGVAADTYAPDTLLNREQAATMLTRVFKRVTIPGWTLATDADYTLDYPAPTQFADHNEISTYALDSVYFMAAHGIIEGTGNNIFAPKNATTAQEATGYANATREAALLIAIRMVEKLG